MDASRCAIDVAIVGGGPAGSAAALTLARYTNRRILLIEGTHYETPRPGEAVSAGIVPLVRYLGVDSFLSEDIHLRSFGSSAAWGSPQLVSRDLLFTGRGFGWHLNRARFDASLTVAAEHAGAVVMRGTWLRGAYRFDQGWLLHLRGDSVACEVEAAQVIDASGRAAAFARLAGVRRHTRDKLAGVVAWLKRDPESEVPQTTTVEAVRDGWWYTAPIPGGQAVVAFMTDADLIRHQGILNKDVYLNRLRATEQTAHVLSGATLCSSIRAWPAETSISETCIGDGWVSSGDATSAFDPLSSLGIGHALASGIQAARVTDAMLNGSPDAARIYQSDVVRYFDASLQQQQLLYAAERRWCDSLFWSRRHNIGRLYASRP